MDGPHLIAGVIPQHTNEFATIAKTAHEALLRNLGVTRDKARPHARQGSGVIPHADDSSRLLCCTPECQEMGSSPLPSAVYDPVIVVGLHGAGALVDVPAY